MCRTCRSTWIIRIDIKPAAVNQIAIDLQTYLGLIHRFTRDKAQRDIVISLEKMDRGFTSVLLTLVVSMTELMIIIDQHHRLDCWRGCICKITEVVITAESKGADIIRLS